MAQELGETPAHSRGVDHHLDPLARERDVGVIIIIIVVVQPGGGVRQDAQRSAGLRKYLHVRARDEDRQSPKGGPDPPSRTALCRLVKRG